MKIEASTPDGAVLAELGRRLARHRLSRNLTQAELAREAGVSKRTVERVEAGDSAQMSSIVRLCRALGLVESLNAFVPEPAPSPVAELRSFGKERRRASHRGEASTPPSKWTWGDEP